MGDLNYAKKRHSLHLQRPLSVINGMLPSWWANDIPSKRREYIANNGSVIVYIPSNSMTEDVGCWKSACQYIQRELKEADEANLLDEEDMHVFGLRPMTDPLILVSCNSCKKPVKASQYANHAEICKSLSLLADSTTETDVAGKKKPPRKEKKKLQISNSTRAATVGKHEKCAIANSVASNSCVNEQTLKETSFPTQPKDMLSVPAPLATKIFYSQRNQRLRSAISHMYYRSSFTQDDNGLSNMQFPETNGPSEKDGH
ncbi:hypothetical protein E3N88_27244 [Mikania micrantha]|uniref:SAGA-associated factor 11 n=1 Tax=Mikania micrantha TaxID=192012 RepID=A0A5N6LAH6_9ASTR|nr:hypothetical protein E3N88_44983 [Mikania micrantha]KAD4178653.1 hypothetical protein E3N88_27244 [Mikania micrantha]